MVCPSFGDDLEVETECAIYEVPRSIISNPTESLAAIAPWHRPRDYSRRRVDDRRWRASGSAYQIRRTASAVTAVEAIAAAVP
jgi:hypothetical protein